jgi:imidazolonepropionase-like amidohydrolase
MIQVCTKHFFARFATALCVLVAACEPDSSPEETLALVGGRIYPSPEAEAIDNGVVLIEDGRIAFVGSRSDVTLPVSTQLIDCTGQTIVAGFWNSHVHIALDNARSLETMLTRYGFTTVVDTGSTLDDTLELRRAIESGAIAGPRILTAGEPLYPEDGVPYYVSGPEELVRELPQPKTPEEAADVANQHIDEGADLIKLFAVSWVRREGEIGPVPMDVERMRAAAEAAHARGRLVFAHPSTEEGVELALASGVDVLAHASEQLPDDSRAGWPPELVDRLLASDMSFIPTLTLFNGKEHMLAQVRAYAGRGRILFGTDVGFVDDYESLTAEFGLMEQAGMTFSQILGSLTTAPAELFGFTSSGQVAPGFDADLVVLRGDPANDVNVFADVAMTLRQGAITYRAE